jgi:hypothetical protein
MNYEGCEKKKGSKVWIEVKFSSRRSGSWARNDFKTLFLERNKTKYFSISILYEPNVLNLNKINLNYTLL